MVDVNITCYHNEDLDRDYVLRQKKPEFATVKKPTLEQTDPIDLTGCTFESTAKFGAVIVTLTVSIVDSPNGRIQLFLDQPTVALHKSKSAPYDLLMIKGGVTKRLWGGTLEVLPGTTIP